MMHRRRSLLGQWGPSLSTTNLLHPQADGCAEIRNEPTNVLLRLLVQTLGVLNPYGGEGPPKPKCSIDDPEYDDDFDQDQQGHNDSYGYDQQPPSEDEASTAAPSSADEGLTDGSWDCSSIEGSVIPSWDGRLAQEQLLQWEVAEKQLGIARSVRGWLAAKKKSLGKKALVQQPPDTSSGQSFYPSATFCGKLAGFVSAPRWKALGTTVTTARQRPTRMITTEA